MARASWRESNAESVRETREDARLLFDEQGAYFFHQQADKQAAFKTRGLPIYFLWHYKREAIRLENFAV
jgi:hypothetical protein